MTSPSAKPDAVTEPTLRVDDLHVSYGHVQAVRGVSFSVPRGHVLGVLGANGAGKSTLLKAIAGLVPAASGTVRLAGRDIGNNSVERRVRSGVVLSPEGRGMLTGMTVEENLVLGGFSSRLSRRELAGKIDEMCSLFPVLGERLKQQSQSLSGGEAAMLSIARALVSEPTLLLLDEPTLGLAPIVTQRLFERIAALRELDLTMVVVEQRATQLLEVADSILQMRSGRAVAHSETSKVGAESLTSLYFGSADIATEAS